METILNFFENDFLTIPLIYFTMYIIKVNHQAVESKPRAVSYTAF